ncbi:MAG: 4Fe-4S dicluster domain-containing protein [Caldimicrobium sp.]
MSKYVITQNYKKCIGCLACVVHCKVENNVPVGPRFCDILPVGPKDINGVPRIIFVYLNCFHCEEAFCIKACPTGAMTKRINDGIVFVKEDLCIGCKSCMKACPWGIPQWNPESGKVFKCHLCMHRIDRGEKPACVEGCTTSCLTFSLPEEATLKTRKDYAEKIVETLKAVLW